MNEETADMSSKSGAARTLHENRAISDLSHKSRKTVLDEYSAALSARAETLDRKAAELSEAENDVRESSLENERERDRLAELEKKIRLDMASFLDEISSKQAVLGKIEKERSATLLDARKKYEKAKKLLSSAICIDKRIMYQKAELRKVEDRFSRLKETEVQLQNRIDTLQPRVNDYDVRLRVLSSNREEMATLRKQLEEKESELSARELSVAKKEKHLNTHEEALRGIESENDEFRRTVNSLRSLLETVNPGSSSDLSPSDVVQQAAKLASELYTKSDTFVESKNRLERAGSLLDQREAALDESERRVRRREDALTSKEAEIHLEFERARNLKLDASQRIEDARAQTEAIFRKETAVSNRESDLLRCETKSASDRAKIDQRERVIQSLEASLKLKGQSLERKETFIESREKAVDAKDFDLSRRESELVVGQQELRSKMDLIASREAELTAREKALVRRETLMSREKPKGINLMSHSTRDNTLLQQSELSNLRTQLALREDTLKSRERALAYREDALKQQEAILRSERSALEEERGGSREGGKSVRGDSDLFDKRTTFQGDADVGGIRSILSEPGVLGRSEEQRSAKETNQHQISKSNAPGNRSTVRKRLAFATPLAEAHEEEQSKRGYEGREVDEADDSSAKAAEELLNELLAARALWVERINRLNGVVQQMLSTSSDVEGVQKISAELMRLKGRIENTGAADSDNPIASFEEERRRHIEWGGMLREQLAAIERAQTSLLLKADETQQIEGSKSVSDPSYNETETVFTDNSWRGSESDTEFRMFRSFLGNTEDGDAASQLDRILARARSTSRG